jgi:hypothetical protein
MTNDEGASVHTEALEEEKVEDGKEEAIPGKPRRSSSMGCCGRGEAEVGSPVEILLHEADSVRYRAHHRYLYCFRRMLLSQAWVLSALISTRHFGRFSPVA